MKFKPSFKTFTKAVTNPTSLFSGDRNDIAKSLSKTIGVADPWSALFTNVTRAGIKAYKGFTEKPSIDTSEASGILDETEAKAKKARARILATAGGILGEEVDSVQKSGRNLFGN